MVRFADEVDSTADSLSKAMLLLSNGKKEHVRCRPTVGFALTARLPVASIAMMMMIWTMAIINAPTGRVLALATPKKVYRYFGYGSNVIPSTMKTLRQIEVREVTAAILPDYELKFASAAFVRPVTVTNRAKNEIENDIEGNDDDAMTNDRHDELPISGKVVHGLLYTLTEDEFAKVGQTEGVPFGYRWQSCNVYPYRGDGKQAGIDCLNDPDADTLSVQAYTLVEPTPASSQQKQQQLQQRRKKEQLKRNNNKNNKNQRGGEGIDMPPSTSYLGLIREGARLWKFDRTYQDELATIQSAKSNNFLFPDGWEGLALQVVEKATGTKRTYMIDGYK
jgi:hypothetical protein